MSPAKTGHAGDPRSQTLQEVSGATGVDEVRESDHLPRVEPIGGSDGDIVESNLAVCGGVIEGVVDNGTADVVVAAGFGAAKATTAEFGTCESALRGATRHGLEKGRVIDFVAIHPKGLAS